MVERSPLADTPAEIAARTVPEAEAERASGADRAGGDNGSRGATVAGGGSFVPTVRVPLPTPYGVFEAVAFEARTGFVLLALTLGDVTGDPPVLTRVHSECLTGDVLGSLRCDCGVQLRAAMRMIAEEGRGVLLYATGHEGRGIGLLNKLRAYVEQDAGADTVDANLRLGLGVDQRDYSEVAAVLRALGVERLRLLSNNPLKAAALIAGGLDVVATEPLTTAAHSRNLAYLRTKQMRLGHAPPTGPRLESVRVTPVDVSALLGRVQPRPDRPFVVLKYAQTLDGRIATASGDSQWISGERERALSHALRAACDAVLVGVGTAQRDDPRLTVRLVPGSSPMRVVLDSSLRTPVTSRLLSPDSPTVLMTSTSAPEERRDALRAAGARIRTVPGSPDGVDLVAALADLFSLGVRTLLVEGGARVITSFLAQRVVDRLVVSVSPCIVGAGTEAVGDLRTARVADALPLRNRSVHLIDEDVVLAWDLGPAGE